MSRKDYQMIAAAIGDALEGSPAAKSALKRVAGYIADGCKADNSRFDRSRFIRACGLEAGQ